VRKRGSKHANGDEVAAAHRVYINESQKKGQGGGAAREDRGHRPGWKKKT